MRKREKKKLNKIIRNNYLKNNQRLYVHSEAVLEKNTYNVCVYLAKDKNNFYGKYLFDISTWSDYVLEPNTYDTRSYFNDNWFKKYIEYYKNPNRIRPDTIIAQLPLYHEFNSYPTFVLHKFGNITKEDIYNCTKYFIHEILKTFLIWNIEVIGEDNDD